MKALLGVQSYFSFHWGVASPSDWFRRTAELGYGYLGIADNAALHGMPEIVRMAESGRVAAVHGASFRTVSGRVVIAHVETPRGYGNLCQRISDWQRLYAARPPARAGGVPALEDGEALDFFASGESCAGLVFVVDDPAVWRALATIGAEVYWRLGPTLAAPPQGVDPGAALFAPGPILLAERDFDTHRLLRAVGGATTLDRVPSAVRFSSARPSRPHLLMARPWDIVDTPENYAERFAPYADAVERADELACRLARFHPNRDLQPPPTPAAGDGEPESGEALDRLRRLAYDGAAIRYNGKVTEAVRERLDLELDLIKRKGFAEYFLVVHDIVARLAGGDGKIKRGRSVTCGRGSGAASLVNYCLGVTNVDVLKHKLVFARFLNEARVDPPDIDVDFAWDERDDLLDRVFSEYGRDRVGRVANHNRYDWRGAFRAAARALGFSDPEITRHLRESPSVYAADPNPGTSPVPGDSSLPATNRIGRRLGVLRRTDGADWNLATRLAERLVDIPHTLSMHCGGVVISTGPISRAVPTVVSRKGMPTIQWEKDGSEDMGLVKMDLLGNRSLAVIRDAVRAVAADEGLREEDVIRGDPTDDPATRALVERGDTFGVFYLESPAMRLLMAKARRGDFKHAVIHSSIIRPAANAFINEYLERLHGKQWRYEDPLLEGLFDESHGIPVYQEDVVKLAMALTNCDYAKADGLRKSLGKRDARERIRAVFPELAEVARARRVGEKTIREFWRLLMSMTGYSFCKPHSASYAQVSFEAAYLRAHYPAYFMAAVLSNGGGYYSSLSYVSEAMRLGLDVRGPDVNTSETAWRAEGRGAIRAGFMTVSGLSRTAAAAIINERKKNGSYAGLADFLKRVRLATDDMRRLVIAGGLDSLARDLNRPQILWRAGPAAGESDGGREGNRTGSLFETQENRRSRGANREQPPDLPPYTSRQRRETEYAILGFIPGEHPLVLFEDEIRESARPRLRRTRPVLTEAGRLHEHVHEMVTILAWPVAAKIVQTKHGDAMMFQSFEDMRSLCEAVIFPEEFQRYHRFLATEQPLWVTGRVEEEFKVATLRVLAVETIQNAAGIPIPTA